MTNAALRGKPDAGSPHVRFDEGEVAPAATPRRGSLLYKTEQVAGIISVSGIADPLPDARANPARYVRLFGGREPTTADFDAMSIMKLVRTNGPRILLTHAKEDTVVPVESAANFYNAYRNAGNDIFFFLYSANDEANTGGHAIWRKDYPVRKRLLNCIENEIEQFICSSQKCSPQSTQSSL